MIGNRPSEELLHAVAAGDAQPDRPAVGCYVERKGEKGTAAPLVVDECGNQSEVLGSKAKRIAMRKLLPVAGEIEQQMLGAANVFRPILGVDGGQIAGQRC